MYFPNLHSVIYVTSLNFSYKEGLFTAIFVILQLTITSQIKHNTLLQIKHVHEAWILLYVHNLALSIHKWC